MITLLVLLHQATCLGERNYKRVTRPSLLSPHFTEPFLLASAIAQGRIQKYVNVAVASLLIRHEHLFSYWQHLLGAHDPLLIKF